MAIRFAGDPEHSAALLARALENTGPGSRPAYALLTAAHVALHTDGDVSAARRGIAMALDRVPDEDRDDPRALTRALASAVELDALTMRSGREEAVWKAPGSPGEARSLRLLATLSDPTGAGPPDRRELDAAIEELAIEELAEETDATVVLRVAGAVIAADRLNDCRPALLSVAGADGDGATHLAAAMLLAMGDYRTRRWAEAARRCDDGLALVGPRGNRLRVAQFRCVRMMLAAARGETEEVRRICSDVEPWSLRQGVQALVTWCRLAQGLDAVGRADFEAARSSTPGRSPRPGRQAPRGEPRGAASTWWSPPWTSGRRHRPRPGRARRRPVAALAQDVDRPARVPRDDDDRRRRGGCSSTRP